MLSYTFVALCITGLARLGAPQTIDPSTVDNATKSQWCTDQKASCPLLCLQLPNATNVPNENNCSDTTLSYSCICSNGQQPNASEYSQTIPYYECTTAATQCVSKCQPSDSSCQSACRNDHPCDAQSPATINSSTISTMSATSTGGSSAATADSAATGVYTGFGGASSSTGTSTSNAADGAQAITLSFGRAYGLAMVLAGVCGGFVFVL